MLFAGALFTAVVTLLGIFTKLPQGGGGLINNLMAMSCFYATPPLLLRPPPPRVTFFDLDASVLDIDQHHIRKSQATGNITLGPMSNPFAEPRAVSGSKNPSAPNATFSLPGFAFHTFSPPLRFYQLIFKLAATVIRIGMVSFALSLPWLVARQLYLLEVTVSVRKAVDPSLIIAARFEQRFWQVQPHNPLFHDLNIAISECDEALVELMRIKEKTREEEREALERENENDKRIKELHKEHDDLCAELAKGEKNLGKLQRKNEDELELLKKQITKQARASEEKEKEWAEKKAGDDKRTQEDEDSHKLARQRESDGWRREVEKLEAEKQGEKEIMGRELRNISDRMKKERERWAKEGEGWKKERENEAQARKTFEAERRRSEEKTKEEKKSSEEANDRAQRRIVELEDEHTRLIKEAVEKGKLDNEREAARKAVEETREEEARRWEEAVQAEAIKATSKLEEEILNGRKLIEDLQSDKRRDRQLLLEQRAQLIRPTHATPPTHINPLRFGGSAQAAYAAPIFATSPIAPSSTSPPTILPPKMPPPLHLNISSLDAANQGVDWPPIVRLPPPPPPRGGIIPTRIRAPPPNVPKRPEGWTPGPPGRS